jgi:hypothetical protein
LHQRSFISVSGLKNTSFSTVDGCDENNRS